MDRDIYSERQTRGISVKYKLESINLRPTKQSQKCSAIGIKSRNNCQSENRVI
jgi:hypothetical protein